MSKIDDIMHLLTDCLSGIDHSNTPQLRQTVQLYINACNEVNQQLDHCRQMLTAGLFSDAGKFCSQMQPSLPERVHKLLLPADMFRQLQQISRLYGYGEIPVIDASVLQQLNSPAAPQPLNQLIMRWRKLARSGNTTEKIKLLHKIIAALPEPSPIWQNNLQAVERQHIDALTQAARQAMDKHDTAQLTEIYLALSNPELTLMPPEALLQQMRPLVAQYQQQQFNTELVQKRTAIYSAYSSMAPELAATLLQEYDVLITHPLYQPDTTAEQAIDEVREYVREYQDNRRRQDDFECKTAELINLLDQHADYTVIENTYAALQQLNLPLDQKLTRRVNLRQAEHAAEQHRQHIRKCLYGILLCLVLLAGGCLVLKVIQVTHSYLHYQQAMQQLLQDGNFNGVVSLHNELTRQAPLLLRFGTLTGYKLQAEQKLQAQQTQIRQLELLCRQGELELQKNSPDIPLLSEIAGKMQPLQQQLQTILPSDLAKRSLEFTHKLHRHKQIRQQTIDRDFVRQILQIKHDLDKHSVTLRRKDYDLSRLLSEFKITVQRSEELLKNNLSAVSPAIYEQQKTIVQNKQIRLQQQINTAKLRQQTLQKLQTPGSFLEYVSTLEKLPEKFPDLARGDWQKALQQLPGIKVLAEAAAVTAHYATRQELDSQLAQTANDLHNNCFIRDIERLLPQRNYTLRFNTLLNRLQNDLQPLYSCREIGFIDNQNQRWFFYTRQAARIEHRRSSSVPKAVKIKVMLQPDKPEQELLLRIKETPGRSIVFIPVKFSGQTLPPVWSQLLNMPLTALDLPLSAHGKLLNEVLQRLNHATSAEAMELIIIQTLQQLQQAEKMNIFARAQLVRYLIDFLLLHSVFYEPAVNRLSIALDEAALNLYHKWYQPDVEITHSEAAEKLRNILQNMDPAAMQKTCRLNRELHQQALSRGLHPAGIVLQQASGQVVLHWFNPAAASREIWFHTPLFSTGLPGWQAVELQPDPAGRQLLSGNWQLPHGGVFFAPVDDRNTAELATRIRQQFQLNKNPDIIWPHSWPLNRR